MEHESKSARELITRLFRSVDNPAGRQYVALHQNWQSLVGFDLAAHSEPVDIKRNALVVELDHPGWMQILQLQEKELLARVQREFPELKVGALHMRLVRSGDEPTGEAGAAAGGSGGKKPRGAPETDSDSEVDAAGGEDEPEGIERIDDPELRARLQRLGRMIAERSGGEPDPEPDRGDEDGDSPVR